MLQTIHDNTLCGSQRLGNSGPSISGLWLLRAKFMVLAIPTTTPWMPWSGNIWTIRTSSRQYHRAPQTWAVTGEGQVLPGSRSQILFSGFCWLISDKNAHKFRANSVWPELWLLTFVSFIVVLSVWISVEGGLAANQSLSRRYSRSHHHSWSFTDPSQAVIIMIM